MNAPHGHLRRRSTAALATAAAPVAGRLMCWAASLALSIGVWVEVVRAVS